MARKQPVLLRVESNQEIHLTAEGQFLHALQLGLLQALHEQGILNDMQLRICCSILSQHP